MKPFTRTDLEQASAQQTRRHFFQRGAVGVGTAALATLVSSSSGAATPSVALPHTHFAPSAKRVIYIFQAGGPAQMELYDYKPKLKELHGKELPDEIRKSQRQTGFTAGQNEYPVVASPFKFKQHGQSGAWVSELLPHLAGQVDELCFIKSMHTEAVNHDPAVTMMLTGAQQPGRPSIGSWLSYGIGSESEDLPAFVVLLTPGLIQDASTPLSARHWGSGFLPSRHQGVKFRAAKDPVLFLSNPPGIDSGARRQMLDLGRSLNRIQSEVTGDPEIDARISQYEMAYRMQASVPQLTDLSSESKQVFDLYGPQSRTPGTYAANCLLARRLVEQGVRFVQIFDRDWDHHRNAPKHMKTKSDWFDQPTAALIRDLKNRGMLEDTLVVCGGEFGRTVYCQGPLQKNYGRDHHGGCFTTWLAGGGVRGGCSYGRTDDFSYRIDESPVHVHDLQATILRSLGVDHEQLTYKYQSRNHRLTDTAGRVVHEILARAPGLAEKRNTSLSRPNYEAAEIAISEILVREERAGGDVELASNQSYREKMGRVPIYLNPIEFRILRFLAATPYRPYSRRRIAAAASTEDESVTEESLDEHIASLRRKLGFFRDYVQAVPYIGYRFKA